ncbi:MAG: glycosyltransferase family 2 protein [Rickettsia endosymbiont of Pseudomimeciton antennatum]|nr:glycosyltransferase family 2 protein [Rickettsia endosymbiont of Pseudomimeciton antennatum]
MTNTNIKISVIMPIYNRVNLAIESIKSVIDQTHKNLELILVDDASSDDLSALIAEIKKDPRIKYIRKEENLGAAAVRNVGIENATGEYIAFIDSDDLFYNNKLETQLKFMEDNNFVFSHTSYQEINFKGQHLKYVNSGTFSGQVFPQIISCCVIAPSTVMGRTYLLKNYFFPENLRIGEDVCLWISIASKYEIAGMDLILSKVRIDYATTHAYNPKKLSIGLLNIASFVMHDEYLSKFNIEISKLILSAVNIVNPQIIQTQIIQTQIVQSEDKAFLNTKIVRLFRSLYTYGIIKTCYKIYRKIINKLIASKFL